MQIMGILNVTPDSFSDGGNYTTVEQAVEQAKRMVREGADVIDIGGESTRPGYERISEEEEIRRVVPVIQALKETVDVPLSIDTYKVGVAKEAIAAGADILNSIWAFEKDERLAELVSETGVGVILMHNRDVPYEGDEEGFLQTVTKELSRSLVVAETYRIEKEKIWIDPGVGFGKTYEQNLSVIRHIDRLVAMGYPVLMAASRKSVVGQTLDLPVDEREEGTIAITLYAAQKGCRMVRVHDVEKNRRALQMWEVIQK